MSFVFVPDTEQAEAFLAWKRGETIEFWHRKEEKWWPVFHSTESLHRDQIYRRKPTPTLRRFKPSGIG